MNYTPSQKVIIEAMKADFKTNWFWDAEWFTLKHLAELTGMGKAEIEKQIDDCDLFNKLGTNPEQIRFKNYREEFGVKR